MNLTRGLSQSLNGFSVMQFLNKAVKGACIGSWKGGPCQSLVTADMSELM